MDPLPPALRPRLIIRIESGLRGRCCGEVWALRKPSLPTGLWLSLVNGARLTLRARSPLSGVGVRLIALHFGVWLASVLPNRPVKRYYGTS